MSAEDDIRSVRELDDSECAGVAKRFRQKCSLLRRLRMGRSTPGDPSIVSGLLHLQAKRLFRIDQRTERLRLDMFYRTIDWIKKYPPF